MRITNVHAWPVTFTVKPEFYIVSSAGAHAISRYVLVAIETDAGLTGWGEATVVPQWSGETQGGAEAMIHDYFAPMLTGQDPQNYLSILEKLDSIIDNPFTKAAIEMALLDIVGKMRQEPIYKLLGGPANPLQIPIKFSIGLREPEEAATIASQKVKEGFTAIKLKVGPSPETDLARVQAVREAVGPNIKLNIDVNGGWSVEQAIAEIPRYEKFKLEYVEQPTPRWDINGLAEVRAATGVSIMADEAVFAMWQADLVLKNKAADLISIYPGKNGGLLKAQSICRKAADFGVACHLGSNLEWHIGTAAMCHLAASCSNVPVDRFPVDILGPLYYSVRPRNGGIQFHEGKVIVPDAPGLGMEIDCEQIRKLSNSLPLSETQMR